MVKSAFPDHFSSKATSYQLFRPGYPTELFAYLASLVNAEARALDCATGSGQAAIKLAEYFPSVIGADGSQSQLSNADAHPHVNYIVCTAEKIPLSNHSLDLVTVAQALHWFDQSKFYAEVQRILKPGGYLAVWSYGLMKITPEIDALIGHLYANILGPYWPFERKQVEEGYQHIDFPFAEVSVPAFAMTAEWSLTHLLGYLSTWSALQRYIKTQQDPLTEIGPQLAQCWGEHGARRTVNWPLSVRVGKV